MKNLYFFFFAGCFFLMSCTATRKTANPPINREGVAINSKVILKEKIPPRTINTKNIPAETVVQFAETLQGIPYKYGSMVKEKGFDCSGFINYVFGHYKIPVPRVSKDFTNAGKDVSTLESKRGDIILFTGSDVNSGVVGHMGIITRNDNGVLQFIHAASGQGGGVMISTMNGYFMPRFVKVIRVFNNI
jgi:cell wall-associated NlpC family hydrolase